MSQRSETREGGSGQLFCAWALALLLPAAAWGQQNESDAVAFARQPVVFRPFVFSGSAFPPGDFADPRLAAERIGPYSIETTLYDRDYQQVEVPSRHGRYGAVVTVRPEQGRPHSRFRTLFHHISPADWLSKASAGYVDIPIALGIDPLVLDGHYQTLSRFVKLQVVRGLSLDEQAGAVFAGLHEAVPGAEGSDYRRLDRTWWVGLKRKFYGQGKAEPFECPVAVYRGLATELTFGSPEEAGVRPNGVAAVDAVCNAEEGGFSVCAARNGVVFYYRAFGSAGSRPMTLATSTPLGSSSELMLQLSMMLLVGQDRVAMDDPVAKYLPALGETPLAGNLTVRHLVTHRGGLSGDWGDAANDLAEVVASFAGEVEVGAYERSGLGLALAGKVIEAVSGKPLDRFYDEHLLGPMGCDATDGFGTYGGVSSVSLDVARIGQMLMNGGSYGDFLFIEPETRSDMLPGPDERGLGLVSFDDAGLGANSYGSRSETLTLYVDPDLNLVVVVTRLFPSKDPTFGMKLLRKMARQVDPS